MFRCQICNEVQGSGVAQTKVVTEVRSVTYPAVKDKYGKFKNPEGFETVKELDACPKCSRKDVKARVVDSKVLL